MKNLSVIALCVLLASCTSSPRVAERETGVLPVGKTQTGTQSNTAPSAHRESDVSRSSSLPDSEAGNQEDVHPGEGQGILSDAQLIKLAEENTPADIVPVMDGAKPLAIVANLAGTAQKTVFLLAVAAQKAEDAQFSSLSDLSRLFNPGARMPTFYLEVYEQQRETVILQESVLIGREPVLAGIRALPIRRGAPAPLAVIASFQSRDGEVQEWAIFTDSKHYSQFSTQDTPSIRTAVRDINGDGLLDVLVFRTGIEAGIGYETFITWFRYEEGKFQRYRSTNVVRNLRDFLSTMRQYIIAGNWDRFLQAALPPRTLRSLQEKGMSVPSIMASIFQPASAGTPSKFLELGQSIQNIVFPEIMENPFPDPMHALSLSMTVRIVCCGGENQFYTTVLTMAENPFGPREFYFRARADRHNP